jgi:G-rich domain on putative tyrosine kinase
MSEQIQAPIQDGDEITLKELILKIKEYTSEIIKRWYVPAFFALIFSAYMLYQAYKDKPIYKAELTYMVNEADKSGMGGLGSLLGAFGAGTVGKSSPDMINELARSERIMNTSLFGKFTIDGINDYFANHFIRIYELHKSWEKDTTGLNGFTFKRGNFEAFTRLENKALNSIHSILIGKTGKFSPSFDKKSGIMKMTFESPNEVLSIFFTRTIFTDLGDFYVNSTTERERTNYLTLKAQQDSVYAIIKNKGQSAASFNDYQRGLLLQSDAFKGQMLKRESEVAGAVYTELMKQSAVADYALRNNTPFISSIDLPKEPLEPTKKSKKMAVLIGVFGGVFIGSLLIIFRRIYLNAMA